MNKRYPVMPIGECYGSSKILAACYPELRYAEGLLTTVLDGESKTIEHAWNVATDGTVIDSTQGALISVLGDDISVTYKELQDTQPDYVNDLAREVAQQVRSLPPKRKLIAIAKAGLLLASIPDS